MKHELTNVGIAQLMADLYALPASALQVEIDALRLDLDAWIEKHIVLNPDQLAYLQQLPTTFKSTLQAQLDHSLSHRSSVLFTKQTKPISTYADDKKEEGRGKLIGLSRTNSASYMEDVGVIEQDTLHIDISYADVE